jgi:ferredoxin
MPTVTFSGGDMPEQRVARYRDGDDVTILDLARSLEVPIYWRCGFGTCAACAARVSVLQGNMAAMGNKERNVLMREGRPVDTSDTESEWRLTCSYRLRGESLLVEW